MPATDPLSPAPTVFVDLRRTARAKKVPRAAARAPPERPHHPPTLTRRGVPQLAPHVPNALSPNANYSAARRSDAPEFRLSTLRREDPLDWTFIGRTSKTSIQLNLAAHFLGSPLPNPSMKWQTSNSANSLEQTLEESLFRLFGEPKKQSATPRPYFPTIATYQKSGAKLPKTVLAYMRGACESCFERSGFQRGTKLRLGESTYG